MAQIRVERKHRSLAWLWAILVLVAIAALVWYFLAGGGVVTRTRGGGVADTLRARDTLHTSRVVPRPARRDVLVAAH